MSEKTKKDLIRFMLDRGSRSTAPKDSMESLIDELALFQQLRPFLKQVKAEAELVVQTGRPNILLKKMADYGALVLLYLLHTTDDDKLKFEIIKETMNRAYGRPTEKHVSVKIPFDQMDEKQLDSFIASKLKDPKNKEILKDIINTMPITNKEDKSKDE